MVEGESSSNMATAKTVIQTLGSVAAATMVARTIINDFLPDEFQGYIFSTIRSVFSRCFSSETTLIINEFEGLETNQIYQAAELYLGTLTKSSSKPSAASAHRLRVNKPESENRIQVALDKNEEIVDEFEGKKFKWVLHFHHVESARRGRSRREMMMGPMGFELRSYHLSFHKKHKDLVLEKYLYQVLTKAAILKQENKTIKLHTIDFRNIYGSPADVWTSINLNHPATFETLAMDPELKKLIMSDLDRFVERKDYYRRVGKAWKRGYLLYGPPGTGKSSLIAAMANHLNFDIYDLELGEVKCDSDLRKILVGTGNRSILIVEDIDCSVKFEDREGKKKGGNNGNSSDDDDDENGGRSRVTLSGLLNFIDGLWSSCGDERIIIFTTNYKDKLDPALLRPGRMDMHIHMSYCTASAFKVLARNYLKIEAHERFREIEGLIEAAQVTPAEAAEQLIKFEEGQDDAAMVGLIEFLRVKIAGNGGGIVGDDKGVKIEGVGDDTVKKLD